MTFFEFKDKIGQEAYSVLEKEAEKEVSLALKMDLIDEYGAERYYHQRFLMNELLNYFNLFENLKVGILPMEIVNILFRCKLAFAVADEKEYIQRVGGRSFGGYYGFTINWSDKTTLSIDDIIENRFNILFNSISEKRLLTPIDDFNCLKDDLQSFFNNLFVKLELPFIAFVSDKHIIKEHKRYEPNLIKYNKRSSKNFFQFPSIAYSSTGTETYSTFYAMAYLRTFLNLLRIGNFIQPPQIDFGGTKVKAMAPVGSAILGSHCQGCFCWHEDEKRPWEKTPDGALFLSFGYRGLSKMWLDKRCWNGLENFFIENKIIFEILKNPWSDKSIKDIEPTLDILSSVTQTSDLGAKILLIYCCLEHLFVPGSGKTENKTYIVGGINALKSDLLPWFDELYKLRCDYAHKGYILHDRSLLLFIFKSIKNLICLLTIKLKN